MHAILLAGGHATRLWPITRHRAKPLLPIGDQTLVERLLDQLAPVASDVLLSTNELFADQFTPIAEQREGVRLAVEEQASEQEKPGALGAIFQLTDDLPDDRPLLIAGGDNFYGFDVAALAEAAAGHDGPTVAVKDLEDDKLASQFGIVELGSGTRIQAFHEKPDDPPSTLAATALYYYPPGWSALFDAYKQAAEESGDPRAMMDSPGQILEWAVDRGESVHAYTFTEAWHDIGTAEGYHDALADILGDRYIQGKVDGCELGANTYVFGDATAQGSRLERTILLPGAHVVDSQLDNCIVDSGARVERVQLQSSLIGPHDQLNGV